MPQATDIILNSAGYMITPGTYKRLQDGMAEGLTQRTSITDFFGGQQRALQLERDTFYTSTAVGPTLGGQGVTSWPARVAEAAPFAFVSPVDDNTEVPYCISNNGFLFFAVGKTLYQGPHRSQYGSTSWVVVKTYPNTITDICTYNNVNLLIAFGSAADIIHRVTASGTEVAFAAGERAFCIENYAGNAVWSDARTASQPTVIRMSHGTGIEWRNVEHAPIKIIVVGAELMLVTKQSLYTFTGRVKQVMLPNPQYPTQPNTQIPGFEWTGEFTPFYQQGVYNDADDFRFIGGYGGRTIAWVAGGVHELVPSGDRAGWRSTGLEGRRCLGGCIASGYVIMCIESHSGQNEIWAYNGNGWWRIATKPMPGFGVTGSWCNPLGAAADANGWSVYVWHEWEDVITYLCLAHTPRHTNAVRYAYSAGGTSQLVTPLIDAGDRDKLKAWRKIGAVFASPELHGNLASADLVTVWLDYSINAGATWVTAVDTSLAGNNLANMNVDLESALSGVVSRFIQLRVRWININDWAPILTGLWVEHEALQSPARRRKWTFRIHARDQEVDRDGVLLTRTGRQLIDELWTAWETDTPLSFRDIDYDADPVQRSVRIVGIQEAVAQPADSVDWGDSTITLNLVEV